MNTLAEIYQVWVILKDRIAAEERGESASEMIVYLMDQGYELDDMAYQFSDDRWLMSAVKFYVEDEDLGTDEDDEYDNEWTDEDDSWDE